MKKIVFLILLSVISNVSFSQTFLELRDYEFKTKESYRTEQGVVLKCVQYLYSNPVNKDELNRLIAVEYIMKWMEGTPDFTFKMGDNVTELTKGSTDLFGLYLAAVSKIMINSKGKDLNDDEVYFQAEKQVVDYCANKENCIKPSKKIKKLLKNK